MRKILRYIGLVVGMALPVVLDSVMVMCDEVEGWEMLLLAVAIPWCVISLPAMILPLQGWVSFSIVVVFWGVFGFFGGIFLERSIEFMGRGNPDRSAKNLGKLLLRNGFVVGAALISIAIMLALYCSIAMSVIHELK